LSITLADLPAFNPPYFMGGSALVAVVLCTAPRTIHSPTMVHSGHAPARWRIRVLIVSDYTRPPAALPLRYHELIVAKLGVGCSGLYAEPTTMVLDSELPVALGRRHYAMPKEYDPSLTVACSAAATHLTSRAITLTFGPAGWLAQWLSGPLRLALTLAVFLFTRLVPVLGRAGPLTRALVVLRPRTLARLAWVRAELEGSTLRPLLACLLDDVQTELCTPHVLRKGRP